MVAVVVGAVVLEGVPRLCCPGKKSKATTATACPLSAPLTSLSSAV
jgi:hypothetical protein